MTRIGTMTLLAGFLSKIYRIYQFKNTYLVAVT